MRTRKYFFAINGKTWYYGYVGQNPTGGIPMHNRDIIGKCLLLKLLRSRGMSQADLSAITGIAASTISLYIKNDRIMELRNAKKIAIALKCCIDDLYEWRKL
jgi:putative transcriptional regulator